MDKLVPNLNFVGGFSEINRQSKIKDEKTHWQTGILNIFLFHRHLHKSGWPCLKTTDQCFTQICKWAQQCEEKLFQNEEIYSNNGSETGIYAL